MIESVAKAMCENNGSALLGYTLGRSAYLVLPSGEHVIISIGTRNVKLLTKRFLFGWSWPKVVVSQQIADWEPNYLKLDKLRRLACGAMILDGLVSLISRFRGFGELLIAWPDLKNPIGIAGIENIKRMKS